MFLIDRHIIPHQAPLEPHKLLTTILQIVLNLHTDDLLFLRLTPVL
jgi:hypothetical protein